jgi:hypothetical protein
MARKRTKEEALERIEDLPSINLPYHSKVPAIAHGLNKAYETGKTVARGLIMLDPLNRLADERIVLPLDMVCIPAYQAYMIQGSPSMQIYVRAGETIIPTGGNVRDVEEALDELPTPVPDKGRGTRLQKQSTAYQRKYRKAFAKVAPKYKKKDGTWKKNGFPSAVKAAHRMCK